MSLECPLSQTACWLYDKDFWSVGLIIRDRQCSPLWGVVGTEMQKIPNLWGGGVASSEPASPEPFFCHVQYLPNLKATERWSCVLHKTTSSDLHEFAWHCGAGWHFPSLCTNAAQLEQGKMCKLYVLRFYVLSTLTYGDPSWIFELDEILKEWFTLPMSFDGGNLKPGLQLPSQYSNTPVSAQDTCLECGLLTKRLVNWIVTNFYLIIAAPNCESQD